MEVLEIYAAALAEYRNKNYEKALEILEEFKKIVPNWAKAILLEAYIRRDQKLYLSEINLLKKFFEVIDIAQERFLTADAYSVLGSALRNLGQSKAAVNCFLNSARLEKNPTAICTEISNAIFAASDVEDFTAEEFQNLYAEYRKNLADIQPYEKISYNHKKLRVGYLSADFKEHPVMSFARSLIVNANKNLFDIYCYSAGKNFDAVTEQIKNSAKIWRDISDLSDFDAAKLIRADEIDILFDLSGHTNGNRLPIMAYRPANVQISGIGFMNSTGLNCVDYFLSDEICAENFSAMQNYFSENMVCMTHSHFCYTPIKKMPAPKIAPCTSNDFITFGCFNNFSKITDSMLRAWKKILDAVPNSKLILKHKIFDTAECKNFVIERLKNLEIDIARVEMRGFSADYLEQYNEIDIALDTFPYNGGLTTCEALFMGVPVISLYGERHGTRFGYSILKNIGLEKFAASNFEEYIQRAMELADDKELIKILRKNLRDSMKNSPLMNAKEYVQELEEFYLAAVQ
ncbi:MAG: hypothetical protein IJT73_00440 [Selenomonadaceae bacterium]|nr:hypothetical protein [Selenomonadaceae bacterium]